MTTIRAETARRTWRIPVCRGDENPDRLADEDGEPLSILCPAGVAAGEPLELLIEYVAEIETDPGDRWTPPYRDCAVRLECVRLIDDAGREFPLSREAAAWAWSRWESEILDAECERE